MELRISKPFGVRWMVLFALLAFVSFSVAAQLPTATVLGTVKDSTGGAVAGAMVTATDTDTGVSRTGPSMDDGSYRFSALPVGHYEVSVMKEGFQITTHTGITLDVGQNATIDFTLQVGSTQQTVEVTGEAPLVDTTSSSFGNLVNDAQVTDLPLNGRNWTDLTLMQPGITQVNALNSFAQSGAAPVPPGLNGTLYSTNGGTVRSNSQLLDGADMKTMLELNNTSAINTSLGVDGIKEYKVVSVLPSAEYGLVMGSQTTIVSKGGTNQWHGDAFEYLRNSALDSNAYNVALDTTNFNGCGANDLFAFPCKRIPPYQRNNFGGAFGGPIQKDKTFFYAVFEGLRQRQGQVEDTNTLPAACFVNASTGAPIGQLANGLPATPVTNASQVKIPFVISNDQCVPGSAANPITVNSSILPLAQFFPVPNTALTQATKSFNFEAPYTIPTSEDYGQIRVDHTFSASDSIFLRYTHDDSEYYPLQGSDIRALLDGNSAEIFTTLSETHIFTPTVLNTARMSVSRNWQQLFPIIVASTDPQLPSEPINSSDLFVTDISNYFTQPGGAGPGAIPQLYIPNCGSPSSSTCYSTYGSASDLASYATPGSANGMTYTLSDDVFWTKGKHSFKFGVLANRYDQYPDLIGFAVGGATFPGASNPTPGTNPTGTAACAAPVPATAPVKECPLAAYFEGVYSSLTRATPNSVFPRQFRFYTYGFYAQDDVKALSRLTLNLGFRYEFATVPNELNPNQAFSLRYPLTDKTGTQGPMFENPSLHNFSPRIGFAWDVFGNGKTSVRGGAGIYYDIGTYGQLEESNNIATPNNQPGGFLSNGPQSLTDPVLSQSANLCCTAANSAGANSSAQSQIRDLEPFSVPLPSVASTAVPSPRTVQYNIDQPTLIQRSLGVDQQLPGAMALSVTYVGARDWHLYQEREGNPQAYYPAMIPQPTNAACDTTAGCVGSFVNSNALTPTQLNPITSCPSAGCTAVGIGPNSLPYYCSPADGTAGAPSAAHPCFNNATYIVCTSLITAPVGTSPSCPGKTNPVWNQVSNVTTSGDAYFNSLQVVLNKRTSHGFQFQFAYTWQKLLQTGTGQSTLENALNPHEFPTSGGGPDGTLDRGPSEYNSTDQFRSNFIYRVPDLAKADSLLGKVVDGWGMAAIPSYQTGYPLSLSESDQPLENAVFVTERPSLCPGYTAANFKATATYTGSRTTSTFFNPALICLQPLGTYGNSPVGFFTGPGIWGDNVSFTKDTKARFLGEAGNVQFRFEMFNAINHPSFSGPNTAVFAYSGVAVGTDPAGGSWSSLPSTIASPTAGRDSLSTLTPMRQIQVSLRLVF